MDAPPSDICVPLDNVQFRDCAGTPQYRADTTAYFLYDVANPAAVGIRVKEPHRSRTWWTTRARLQEALVYGRGFGDGEWFSDVGVRGLPMVHPMSRATFGLILLLGNGPGHEHVTVGIDVVRGFLAGTFQMVSAHGETPTDVHFEEIARWLA